MWSKDKEIRKHEPSMLKTDDDDIKMNWLIRHNLCPI